MIRRREGQQKAASEAERERLRQLQEEEDAEWAKDEAEWDRAAVRRGRGANEADD